MYRVLMVLSALFASQIALASDSRAQSSSQLDIELNAANPQNGACRLSFLARNRMNKTIENLVLELVLFDADGKVSRLLSAAVGRMPRSKSRLRQYDVADITCEQIGRILLNDVTQCEGDGLNPEICTSAARTSSRLRIPFEF